MYYIIGLLLILASIAFFFWKQTHCPNCYRIFTRQLQKKGKAGLLPTMISGKERRHYRCSNCGHGWDKVIYSDGL